MLSVFTPVDPCLYSQEDYAEAKKPRKCVRRKYRQKEVEDEINLLKEQEQNILNQMNSFDHSAQEAEILSKNLRILHASLNQKKKYLNRLQKNVLAQKLLKDKKLQSQEIHSE